jgi:hypothetical protein
MANCKFDLGQRRSEIFLRAGLDRLSRTQTDLPVGHNHEITPYKWVHPDEDR